MSSKEPRTTPDRDAQLRELGYDKTLETLKGNGDGVSRLTVIIVVGGVIALMIIIAKTLGS